MAEQRTLEQKQQRTYVIIGLVAAAAAFVYVFWAKSKAGQQPATDTSGGVAPGYGTQLGDIIQFSPADQGGQSGGPGGIAGGAGGNQIGSVSDSAPVGVGAVSGVTAAPVGAASAPARAAGPGGVATAPMASTVRTAAAPPVRAPAPAPAPAPRPIVPTQPRQTVSTVLRSGLRAQGGTGTSVSQVIGILGMGSVSPSRVANAPVAGSTPPRNLPAGLSVNNARRLGL